ncbi:hypothetical protein COV15_00180 [Candidatus Woesearchaeota archaeon CG10_big_fil_rev_8_21_14_0_10_34_12]|nr:MAG: hypothetical protein COV15_00180 [Candidatus Woesearchaeota archaeon CG10_big_fil_rev_8_21_14_0_10_34_12]
MNHNDLTYINHITDAIKDIEYSTKNLSKEGFKDSKDIKDACIRRLEIIGEAIKKISQETKNKYLRIKWKQIAGTRDRIIHAYFNVNLDIVWDIIKINIPVLKIEILGIKKDLEKFHKY